jgi:hypothetical protein
MLEFIAIGTLGFWVCLVTALIAIGVLLENEHEIWASLIVVTLGVIYLKTVSLPVILIGFIGYVIIGGLWSLMKWYLTVQDYIGNRWNNEYRIYGYEELTQEEKDGQWLAQCRKELVPSKYKSRIYGWVAAWPVSITYTVCKDTLKTVYNCLQKQYTRIVDSALASLTPKV